jgi:hypothetical protein
MKLKTPHPPIFDSTTIKWQHTPLLCSDRQLPTYKYPSRNTILRHPLCTSSLVARDQVPHPDQTRTLSNYSLGILCYSTAESRHATDSPVSRMYALPCLERREYIRRNPLRWQRDTLYPQKLVLTSPISGGRSVGTVRSRTKTMEFSLSF